MRKLVGIVAAALILCLLPALPAEAAGNGVTVTVQDGYTCDYGVDIPFTRSPRTTDYTFALYPGEAVSGAPEMTAEVEIATVGQVSVHLPLHYDVSGPSTWTLRVTAHVAPGREGLDREASTVKTFTTAPTCGCPAGTAGAYYLGDGKSVPFAVGTEAQLRHIDQHNTGKSFLQENDITLAQTGGAAATISGAVYDGNGYYIKNLSVNETGNGGLFGRLYNSTVQNVGLTTTNWIKGYTVGGIAGACEGATIQNCFVEAKIMSCDHAAPAHPATGGIAGGMLNSTVTNCYFAGTIQNTSLGSGANPNLRLIGGIAPYARGRDNKQCSITNTYNMADLNYGTSIRSSMIGAVTGDSSYWSGSTNCYSGLVYSANNYWLSTALHAPAYGIGAWYGTPGQTTVNPGPSNAGCAALTSFSSLPSGFGSDWEIGTALFQRADGSSSRVSAPVLKIFSQKHA